MTRPNLGSTIFNEMKTKLKKNEKKIKTVSARRELF